MRFVFIFFCINIVPVSSIKCLQCNSLQNVNCIYGNVAASECPTNKNHSFCTTHSGFLKLGRFLLLLRDCSLTDLGNSCRQVLDDPFNKSSGRLTFCYTTCQHDGCNKDTLRISAFASSATAATATTTHARALLVVYLVLVFVFSNLC